MIHLTPSPRTSFAEKEKHDTSRVKDFLKGGKDTENSALGNEGTTGFLLADLDL